MKKVLLLHCPGDKVYLHDLYCSYSSKASYYWTPSDLILLSGVLRDFDLSVVDAIAERLSEGDCEKRILDIRPEAVVFVTGTATWKNDLAFVTRLKEKMPCLLVGTSSLFLFEAESFLREHPQVDALILDIVDPDVAGFIRGERHETQALAVRRNDRVHVPERTKLRQDFQIGTPRHELFKWRLNRSPLARRHPLALVIASLGCPFSCTFCVAGSIPYRFRNVANVLEELLLLRSLGVREIMFNDSTFTVSEKRVKELCQGMLQAGLDLTWYANAHVATLSGDMLQIMKEAGCHTLMIGVESGSDEILKCYAKKTTKEEIRKAFRLCKKHRIRTLAYFIIGLPGETEESLLETIRFAKELDCDFASFTVPTPDIGSRMRGEAIEKGWLDPGLSLFDSTCFPVFSGEGLTKQEVWKWRQRAVRQFYLRPSYLLKQLGSVRSFYDLKFLAEQALSMFLK